MATVFNVAVGADAADSYSRANPFSNNGRHWGEVEAPPVVAVPISGNLAFFGDMDSPRLFEEAVAYWQELGAVIVKRNIEPLLEAARLLYSGPWVAERYAAIAPFIREHGAAIHPVVSEIILGAENQSAVSVFQAEYRMQGFRKACAELLEGVSFLLTPTAPCSYRIREVLDDPLQLNANMGYYTNYMNLLDLCGVAVPAGFMGNGIPFGVTLVAAAFQDQALLSYAHLWQKSRDREVGCGVGKPVLPQAAKVLVGNAIEVAVCGAHLSGMPLNWQLSERGATLVRAGHTSAGYRLYALAGVGVARPGLVRDQTGGAAIEIEIWTVPRQEFGDFVANIPPPLGIGKLETESGDWICGFICEPYGLEGAEDITALGGWRAYMAGRTGK